MDITLYTSLTASASLVTEKTGLAPSDLNSLLDVTAGILGEVQVYRPYYVAAKLLSTRRTQIESAEGAQFVDPLAVAGEYLKLQRAIDVTLGLTVPEGAEATLVALMAQQAVRGTSGTAAVIGTW